MTRPGQLGGRLQQQRQHRGLRISSRRVSRPRDVPGLSGAAVHLPQQCGEIGRGLGEQGRQQDLVFLGHVRGEKHGDLSGLLRRRGSACCAGEPPGCRGEGAVLGGHLPDGAGQAAIGPGGPVESVFLRFRVREHLIGQVRDQRRGGPLMRAAARGGPVQGLHPRPEPILERPVMRAHGLKSLGLGDRHGISLLRMSTHDHSSIY